jgi:hypothetical protein
MAMPILLRGRRTAGGVAAYFDLITDEGRLFYGDSFHFGYFRTGSETSGKHSMRTRIWSPRWRARPVDSILDVGCGLGRRRYGSPSGTAARSLQSTSAANRFVKDAS